VQYLGFYRRPLATGIFIILIFLLFWFYFKLLKRGFSRRWLILLVIIALPAYPIFSYDIFNYLFNAKMVLIYHANPHLQTAINFAFDPMLRFMHNVHTSAPYAYGWTGLSLLPGLAWLTQNFTLSFWAMKLFIVGFWLGQLWILQKLVHRLFPQQQWRFWLFALNPLVLVETFINGHNDVVMMFFALLSYWFFLNSQKFRSLLFLLLSASIKYVTIVLLPFYLQGLSLKVKKIDLPTLFSFILLGIMFIRPGQLHSWYLIWAFSFIVLSRSNWLIKVFTALTIGALLRYAPYLYYGHWDAPVYLLRNLIWALSLFLAPLVKI
ncbi:hypothetical protein KKE48_00180, partial [Patescibacteria group bacterium]|nr:hypothetical protein [Patescibacteria group bacterium]